MRRGAATLVLVACALLGGCTLARRTPAPQYYTLAVLGAPPVAPPAPIIVDGFTAEEPYTTARLAYRTSPWQLGYYVYNRWAGDPRRLLAAAARDYLERTAPAGDAAPFTLAGHIRRLEEVDDGDARTGALALDVTVTRGEQGVLTRSYAETEPADGRTPEAVAAALSRALGRVLDHVVTDLVSAPR